MNDKIARIEPYLVPGETDQGQWWARMPYLLVRVETGDGIVGWGECHYLSFRHRALIGMIHDLGAYLTGRPAAHIRALWAELFHGFAQHFAGPEVHAAAAGIEIALWDILGKRLGCPVYRLLGGACHGSVAVYANLYSPRPQSAEAFAEMAARQVAAGHRAIKIYPFRAGAPIAEGAAIVSAVRDAIGPGIGLAVDLWRHATPERAIAISRALEPYDLLWLEDPVPPTDATTVRYIRDRIPQPLLSGETLPARRDFATLFECRAVDMVNPDICLSGIIEFQAIAAVAESALVTVSPHNCNSMAIGTVAAMHASLGLPNLGLLEHFPLFESALDDICAGRPEVREGRLAAPDGPGLGLRFDENALSGYRV